MVNSMATVTVKKFNYLKFSIFIIIVICILASLIVGPILLINHINYKKTYEYKFTQLGYNTDEFAILKSKLSDKELENVLNREYNRSIVDLVNQKYFIFSKLDNYIDYISSSKEDDYYKIVAIINTNANIEWIDEERETNIKDNELMLVNRLYGLNSEFVPEELTTIPVKYAFDNKKIDKSIVDKITKLIDDAREDDISLIVSEGYRSYNTQKDIYNSYVDFNGRHEADKKVARPGHSEYQTGLTFDIEPYNKIYDDPKSSNEYKWLVNNIYKYGFIFRHESGKEYLTGFDASLWKLRYVGEKAAKIIHDENICFEEYYAYYVMGDKKNE